MQAEYEILPKRTKRSDGSLAHLRPIKFFTNYYGISINQKYSKIFQYSFALSNEIEADSELYNLAINSSKAALREKIGYLTHSGQMIWGSISLTNSTTIQSKFQHESQTYNLESILTPTKHLNPQDLNTETTKVQYLHILKSSIKSTLNAMGLVQRGKQGEYFYKKIENHQELEDQGLCTMRGMLVRVVPLRLGLCLQVDATSRVLQLNNLLEDFREFPKDRIKQMCAGRIVIAKYGTYRNYTIQSIDFTKTPLSTFQNSKTGLQTTYKDYYKQVYGLQIKNLKQPLILTYKSIKKVLSKDRKYFTEQKQYIYLVPEFVSMAGMYDYQRSNKETMKVLGQYVKLSPMERVRECALMIQRFNQRGGIVEIREPKKMEGFSLEKPTLRYGNQIVQPDNRGNIRYRGPLRESGSFTDWLFVYSVYSQKDTDEAYNAVHTMKRASEAYGITIRDPIYVKIESSQREFWKKSIKKQMQKNKKLQIIVVFVIGYQQKFYPTIKKMLINELKIPSQFIRKRTLRNIKNAMSSASKIVIQMCAKIGITPWEVQVSSPYIRYRNRMYGALSLSKQQKGYTLAFTGTTNNQSTKVYSQCLTELKSKQNLQPEILSNMFINWASSYIQAQKGTLPELIILYIEGLSLPQTKTELSRSHIPALEAMVKEIGRKTDTANYDPELMIVVVNTRVNSRFYNFAKPNDESTNKFVPELLNVDSGSVIGEPLSQQDSYDFHLASQYVTQGTCTPTLYRVAYSNSKMPEQALITFTYEQCFNYYNWQGAIKIPACLQYANKLSKLVSQSLKENVVESQLCRKHYFL